MDRGVPAERAAAQSEVENGVRLELMEGGVGVNLFKTGGKADTKTYRGTTQWKTLREMFGDLLND